MTTSQSATPADAKQSEKSKYFRKALGDITPNNIGQLKALNSVIFPVKYTESFYKDAIQAGEFAKLVYFNDICVGGVICRRDQEETGKAKLYIATLGVLAAYRRLGLGTMLLEHIIYQAEQDNNISELYLHVQTNNEDALRFYKTRGFEVTETIEGYYKKNQGTDPNAHCLVRKMPIA